MLAKVPWPAVVRPRSEGGQYPCLCFSLAGGAQFVLFCSVDPFVSRFFCLLISCLLSSWPVCAASCVLLWFVRSLPRSVGFVPTSSVSAVQSLRLPWQYCQTAVILVFGWIMSPTREARLIAYPLLGCSLRMRREQPVLDRHRPVSNLCGDLGPSLQGWLTLLPVSHPVSTGGVTRRSASCQLCGLALLTRWTCPHLDGRLPYSGRPRQLSQKVRTCLVPRKNPTGCF